MNRFAADELRLGELRQRNYIRLFIIYALIALISLARCLPISPSLPRCLLNSFRFVSFASILFCFAPSFVVDICRNRAPRIIFRFAYHKVDWVSAIKQRPEMLNADVDGDGDGDDVELVCRWLC